jgi:uncharacterized membrane protein YhaH (DUF805 family)
MRRLLLSGQGRVGRSRFWLATVGLWVVFVLTFVGLEAATGRASTLLLYPPFFWVLLALLRKRLHDRDKSSVWLLLLLVPLLGPLWIAFELCLLPGSFGDNRYGSPPGQRLDYLAVS